MDDREREREEWKTLHGRIEWVVRTKKISESEWSKKAFAGRNRGQVQALKKRSIRDWKKYEREHVFEFPTIEALAGAVAINALWLAKGLEGGRPDDGPDASGRYTWMQLARDAARASDVDEAVIRAVEAFLVASEESYSFNQVYRMMFERNKKEKSAASASPEEAKETAEKEGLRPSGVPPPKQKRKPSKRRRGTRRDV